MNVINTAILSIHFVCWGLSRVDQSCVARECIKIMANKLKKERKKKKLLRWTMKAIITIWML